MGDRYSWHENEWEVEVTVPVPPGTAKGEVLFKATPTSLSLALAPNASAPLMAVGMRLSGGSVTGRHLVLLCRSGARTHTRMNEPNPS